MATIEFPRPQHLDAQRSLDGLVLTIPSKIAFKMLQTGQVSMVSDLHAFVSMGEAEVGVARDEDVYKGDEQEAMNLSLRLPAAIVRRIEGLRNGKAPAFKLDLRGKIWLLSAGGSEPRALTEPETFRRTATVGYDVDVWAAMLHATGFGDNVFVEIPLPPSPGPPWDEVWKALRTARDALNRGGSMAWKTAVSECRVALEKWENIDGQAIDHGVGGLTANRDQREARTVNQRRDALRWHAHQLAHYFQHNHADECTRDDAVLVLATLAGLLAVRKP
jgi:hypothetical protein